MEFASQASAVASALKDRCESVAIAYWGEPTFRSPRALRWGNRGSRSLTTAGDKRGLWCDFEREEGGDVLHLIAREEGVSLGEAITLAVHEFLGPYTPTPLDAHGERPNTRSNAPKLRRSSGLRKSGGKPHRSTAHLLSDTYVIGVFRFIASAMSPTHCAGIREPALS